MALDPAAALLTDKVAIVTGAAVGIGQAIALTFANFGAHVAICDRDAENLKATSDAAKATGRRTVATELDVREPEAVTAFVDSVSSEFGYVDVLVNNAGGTFFARFLDTNAKGQDSIVRENFVSVTSFVRATVAHMPESGGSIINVTSIEAFRAAPGFGIYAAMKAAVESLTKTLALELADRRVRVNCIAPDAIPTEGDAGLAEAVHAGGVDDYGAKVPLGLGHVDDAAAAAVFLAGDLSRFVTGTTVHVDAGMWAAGGWHRGDDGRFTTS